MYPMYKIKEARFFLENLQGVKAASEEFCFYVSALLSAARSVTFAMQKLYKHRDGFDGEYGQLVEELKAYKYAREVIEARNISEKEGHKVPVLVTTSINIDTKDKIVYETDPLPYDCNDVIRKISFEYGDENEGWIPADLPEDVRKEKYMAQFYATMERMTRSTNRITTYGIKLFENGKEKTMQEFYDDMNSFLNTLEEAAIKFDRLWPSLTAFSNMVQKRPSAENSD